MSIQLTPQQQEALDSEGEVLPRVIDPRTNAANVLVHEPEFESIRELIEEDRRPQAIHAVALRNAVGRMDADP